MTGRRTLNQKKIIASVNTIIESKLTDYQNQVFAPRFQLIDTLQKEITALKEGQERLLHRLDTVSANGNPGLENSLKDIYNKLKDLHTDLLGIQTAEKAKWYNMTLSQLFKKRWMKPIWTIVALVLINTILHQFNLSLDIQSLTKVLMSH